MAIGKASDFKVYQEYLRGGIVERLTQASNFFNNASRGAIQLTTRSLRGDYEYESFIKNISGIISRRDTTSVSAATPLIVAMDEFISVKLNRKIGPIDQTLDAFRKVLMRADGPEALSFLIGTQVAKAMEVEMLNTAIRAVRAALNTQSDNKYEEPSSGTITSATLNNGLFKFGDAVNQLGVLVMHSSVAKDLIGYQIDPSNNGDNVAGVVVNNGIPATFGRPFIVTDSDALVVDEGTSSVPDNVYHTLALVPGAVVCENTETEHVVYDEVTGLENLVARLQGEYAYNVGVKGFKWDVANGGANPNDTAIGTGSNWDKSATDKKDLAGVVIRTRVA